MAADADEVRGFGSLPSLHVVHSKSKNVHALINELGRRGDVLTVEPNYIVRNTATPNDPSFPLNWALANTGQSILGVPGTSGADIGAKLAWDVSTGGTTNVVAVVDSGVDYNHPDLAANIWSAPAAYTVTMGNLQITCPAGSHGYNALNNSCDPMDDRDHGTHTSGTIGAAGNNTTGVTGVNWSTKIMALKFLDSTGSGSIANAITAIDFAIQTQARFAGTSTPVNIRVLSNSWGGAGFTQSLLDAINRAGAANMLFVVAAGNSAVNIDTSPDYPASYGAANQLTVAATDNTDAMAGFSNYGTGHVHLGAPGVSVLSTVRGGAYAYMSGTSMATPQVAGAAMLLLSKCTLSTAALRSTLLANVDLISSMANTVSSRGRLNVNKALRACSGTGQTAAGTAALVQIDTTTQGNWKSAYGADGYAIAGNATSYPSYASVTMSGQSFWSWAASTSDPRALQKAAASDRVAATWFSTTSFDIDVNFTDGLSHKVALYALDWDVYNRVERIDVIGYGSNTVLNSQSLSSFSAGKYAVWNITGHVIFRVSNVGTINGLVNGIFFGGAAGQPPPATSTATAAFVQTDTTTAGSWKGVYGADGYSIAGDAASYPAYAQTSLIANSSWTWTTSTSDIRALQKANAGDRVSACWFSATSFDIDVNLTDGKQHRVALYALDWDFYNRNQRIDVIDYGTNAVLNSQSISAFTGGKYLVWNVAGHVIFRVVNGGGINGIVNGIFFGTPATNSTAAFVKTDSTTLGSWKGVYGAGGYRINGDPGLAPSFAQIAVNGALSWTWAASTTDPRALQKTATADRIAACWYNDAVFTIDVNITDGRSHQLAIYSTDYDTTARSYTVDVVNADSNSFLDSRSLSAYNSGKYLVWNVTGHVQLRFTRNSGYNSVVSGIFLEP
ncbi:MAG TPA: S8 family peptidase [Bryobacteraceae bacterium]|nr:S8 family peptidase [Bryobacteraceae bacterium]